MPGPFKLPGVCLALLLTAATVHAEEPLVVVAPSPTVDAHADSFPFSVLELALERSGRPYVLTRAEPGFTTEARVSGWLDADKSAPNVSYVGTSRDREETLLPVRIPIYGGLLGYRLLAIRDGDQPVFDAVEKLEDLDALFAIQGRGWSDVEILERNGLPVLTGYIRNLYDLLMTERGDYFPRGVVEIYAEIANLKDKTVTIEDSLVLRYPFAMFFFVAPESLALHDALYDGLAAAHEDGSYFELLRTHPDTADVLKQSNINGRRILDLENPLMTAETLTIPARYWIDVKDLDPR